MLLDEQGLGKTVTAIEAALRVCHTGVLAVVPTVVAWNWQREFETWAPGWSTQVITAGHMVPSHAVDVVIVTHGLLLNPVIRRALVSRQWSATILDEAHFFRTETAKRVRRFYGSHRGGVPGDTIIENSLRVWSLTGTPTPNNPSELWTHLRFLAPSRVIGKTGQPMSFKAFRDRYCLTRPTLYGVKVVGSRNAPELREKLDGFALRRLKANVLDLPAIRFETLTLTPKAIPWELASVEAAIRPAVLAAAKDGLADDATTKQAYAAMRSASEFSAFRRLCGLAKIGPILELLDMELEGGLKKVVIFAHHIEVVTRLVGGLQKFGAVSITGATSAAARTQAVERFQTDASIRVIVCNIIAGGTGTTLTASSDVVFAELSPVPGENAQAADRCHRIGQTAPVRVRFIALAGSIDEDFTRLLRTKTKMIREVLS